MFETKTTASVGHHNGRAIMLGTIVTLFNTAATAPTSANAAGHMGIVAALNGTSYVERGEPSTLAALKPSDDVLDGDQITVGRDSVLRLLLRGGVVATFGEDSAVNIGNSVVTLHRGKIAYVISEVQKRPQQLHALRAPNVTVTFASGILVVAVESVAVSNICMLSGSSPSVVRGGERIVQLHKRQCISARPGLLGSPHEASSSEIRRATLGLTFKNQ